MSLALIAVTLVLLLSHFRPGLARWRQLESLQAALRRLSSQFAIQDTQSLAAVALQVLLPGLLLLLLQSWLDSRWLQLPALLYGVLMLFLCWGPRDLDADVAAAADAIDGEARRSALQRLGVESSAGAERPESVVFALFRAGLSRWFGPLLWFALLGGAGALMFRLARMAETQPRPGSALASLRTLLDWPVAQLMTLALAVVGNFDAVLQAWREWHRARGGWWVADIGFLDAAARRSVDCDLREQAEERIDAADAPAADVPADPLRLLLLDALALLWRVLIAWMVVFALLVIAGVAS